MVVYYFLLHFIADFLLQSRKMGKKKSSELKWLYYHLMIVNLVFIIGLMPVIGIEKASIFALCNTLIHGIIDAFIWKLYAWSVWKRYRPIIDVSEIERNLQKEDLSKNFKYWEDSWFYSTIGLDQFLHGATIVFLLGVL